MITASAQQRAPVAQLQPTNAARRHRLVHHQVSDFRLLDGEIRLRLQHLPHVIAILLLVALRSRRPHCRAARGIQQAELDAHRIGDFAHDAAEGIHFAHEVALGNAANRGIAGHLRDQVEVERDERRAQTHARSGHGGFAAGVTRAHDAISYCSVKLIAI